MARKTLNCFVQNADSYSAGGNTILNMTSKRQRPNSPNFAVLVIALSSAAVIVAGHTAYGITAFVALGFAYLVAVSTPFLSRCAPLDPASKLKRAIFLCAFIAIFLGVFIGRTYPSVPWPEDAASLTAPQVEALLRSYRTLLFGVCTIVAVAYLQIIRLLLHYLRDARNATASVSAQPGTVIAEKDLVGTASVLKP
jgi:hypothetical protein